MAQIPHVYVPLPWRAGELRLTAEQDHHLGTVLRLKSDAPVTYTDGRGRRGSGEYADGRISRGAEETDHEARWSVDVAVTPPSPVSRCRFLIEKSTELAVRRVLWLQTRRSDTFAPTPAKTHAWAVAALEQSRSSWLTETGVTTTLSELDGPIWVADPGGEPIPEVDQDVTLAVGPPGGFEPGEIDEYPKIALGPSLLRSETAVIVGVALIRDRISRTTG